MRLAGEVKSKSCKFPGPTMQKRSPINVGLFHDIIPLLNNGEEYGSRTKAKETAQEV